jgi:NADH-quinone oxidoreductase subunit A
VRHGARERRQQGQQAGGWRKTGIFRPETIDGGWSRSIMLEQYFPVLLFIIVGIGIGLVLLTVGSLVAPDRPDAEKLSPYECGFEAFEDARMKFDVRYYLVAILFILFDLEIAFLFPWAIVLPDIGIFGFWSMMIFLGILIIGFIYEWKKGALEWE